MLEDDNSCKFDTYSFSNKYKKGILVIDYNKNEIAEYDASDMSNLKIIRYIPLYGSTVVEILMD